MRQADLLRELENLRADIERLKKLKLAAREEKYRDFTVTLGILIKGFLEELGEFLSVAFSKDAAVYWDDRREKVTDELIDLSNQIDFLITYLRVAPRYLKARERHHRMPNGKLVET